MVTTSQKVRKSDKFVLSTSVHVLNIIMYLLNYILIFIITIIFLFFFQLNILLFIIPTSSRNIRQSLNILSFVNYKIKFY